MSIIPSKSEIVAARDNKKILQDTAQQVIKDFAMFGLDVEFPNNIDWAYDELFTQLEAHIEHMLDMHDRKLLSLLYQIDIPESSIRRESEKNSFNKVSETITEMVLNRELKKVLTRYYFKDHYNNTEKNDF